MILLMKVSKKSLFVPSIQKRIWMEKPSILPLIHIACLSYWGGEGESCILQRHNICHEKGYPFKIGLWWSFYKEDAVDYELFSNMYQKQLYRHHTIGPFDWADDVWNQALATLSYCHVRLHTQTLLMLLGYGVDKGQTRRRQTSKIKLDSSLSNKIQTNIQKLADGKWQELCRPNCDVGEMKGC